MRFQGTIVPRGAGNEIIDTCLSAVTKSAVFQSHRHRLGESRSTWRLFKTSFIAGWNALTAWSHAKDHGAQRDGKSGKVWGGSNGTSAVERDRLAEYAELSHREDRTPTALLQTMTAADLRELGLPLGRSQEIRAAIDAMGTTLVRALPVTPEPLQGVHAGARNNATGRLLFLRHKSVGISTRLANDDRA